MAKSKDAAKTHLGASGRPTAQDVLIAQAGATGATPIHVVRKASLTEDLAGLTAVQQRWLEVSGFAGEPGKVVRVPGADGALAAIVAGAIDDLAEGGGPLQLGLLPLALEAGDYRLADGVKAGDAALAWAMGAWRFERYKAVKSKPAARLVVADSAARARAVQIADSVWMARDLIMTPASDMGPDELEKAARQLAGEHGMTVHCIAGDDLLNENFPMIHAVGRASPRAPRLVDLSWGREAATKITLVGKGICFDTGGLDIKTADGMSNMKKDMAGAATVLALARMIMGAKLDVRLRVLLPIAENSISGNAFRPGDILHARNGATVEIGNTDAEGRLVLADAMALACEDKPHTLVTYATLTGAARVALGPDLPATYTDDDALAAELYAAGLAVDDPIWRMPLWMPYDKLLKSNIADVNHISGGPHAGSVTAALFLKRFAKDAGRYLHFDIMAWTAKAKPGKPEGAEPQGARALFDVFRQRYGA